MLRLWEALKGWLLDIARSKRALTMVLDLRHQCFSNSSYPVRLVLYNRDKLQKNIMLYCTHNPVRTVIDVGKPKLEQN